MGDGQRWRDRTMTSKIEHRIMTTKEKAKQLYELTRYDVSTLKGTEALINEVAKRCALIAVDEVIDNIEDDYMHYELDWWQEVKQEIEKL